MSSTVWVYPENTRNDKLFEWWICWNKKCLQTLDIILWENKKTIICLSWWPDSIFLFIHCIAWYHSHWYSVKERLIVVHYMHHMRNDDDKDWEFLTQLTQRYWCQIISASYVWNDFREEVLREHRWTWIDDIVKLIWASNLLSWHTFNDRIENSLLYWIRWSWSKWWHWMSFSSKRIWTVDYYRPLLSVKKVDILSFLNKYAISHLKDLTNGDVTCSERNRIRAILSSNKRIYWIYNMSWRSKFYEHSNYSNYWVIQWVSCSVHPQWGSWKLLRFINILEIKPSLDLVLQSLWLNMSYSVMSVRIWQRFVSPIWKWRFNIKNHHFFRTNGTIYYTTLSIDFWKWIDYEYSWCEWGTWQSLDGKDRIWAKSAKRRLKENVPVFWRSCLPVQRKNDTVQEIYSLVR